MRHSDRLRFASAFAAVSALVAPLRAGDELLFCSGPTSSRIDKFDPATLTR